MFFLGYLLMNVPLNYTSSEHYIWMAFSCTGFSEDSAVHRTKGVFDLGQHRHF